MSSDAIAKAVAEERERLLTSLMQAFGPGWLPKWLREWIVSERSSAPETKAPPRATEADFEALRRVQQNSERLRANDAALREELGLKAAPIPPIGTPGRYRALQKDPAYQALVKEKEREIEAATVEPAKGWDVRRYEGHTISGPLAEAAPVEPAKGPQYPAKSIPYQLSGETFQEMVARQSAEPRPNEAERTTHPDTYPNGEPCKCVGHAQAWITNFELRDLRSRLAQVEAERGEQLRRADRLEEDLQKSRERWTALEKERAQVEAERDQLRAWAKNRGHVPGCHEIACPGLNGCTKDGCDCGLDAALASSGKPGGAE